MSFNRKQLESAQAKAEQITLLVDAAIQLEVDLCKAERDFSGINAKIKEVFDIGAKRTESGAIIYSEFSKTELVGDQFITVAFPEQMPAPEALAAYRDWLKDFTALEIETLARKRREARLKRDSAPSGPVSIVKDGKDYANSGVFELSVLDERLEQARKDRVRIANKATRSKREEARMVELRHEIERLEEQRLDVLDRHPELADRRVS